MLLSSTGHLPGRMLCFGASGTGSLVAYDLQQQADTGIEFLGYVDDFQDPKRVVEPEARVYSFDELLTLDDVGVVVAVHNPAGRRKIFARLAAHGIPVLGSRGLPHLVHPLATIGAGSFVTTSTRLAHSSRLGTGVIGLADIVGHDVEVGDFTTLAYGSKILGHVHIGAGAFIGAGAIIQNGTVDRPLTIGDGAIVGAGAVVDRDVAANITVMGSRAHTLREHLARRGSATLADD